MQAHAEADIAARERDVWTVLADIDSWPTWNPAVHQAVLDGRMEVGGHFRFSTPSGSMACRLTEVDAPRALAWTSRLLTVRQRHAWRIEPRSHGVHVVADATMSGLSPRLLRARMRQRLQGELDALVQLLKLEAETRATEERDDDPRLASTTEGEST